jgi:hypothetical protein
MNRQEAAILSPIIQAFKDGKDVQWKGPYCPTDPWTDGGDDPCFGTNLNWRVKPETVPEQFYVTVIGNDLDFIGVKYHNMIGDKYDTAEDAKRQAKRLGNRRVFKMIEVL